MMAESLFVDITVDLLKRGHSVRFRAIGKSMQPTINEGEIVMVEPVMPSEVKRGDIVLYESHKGVIAHRVVAIDPHHSILHPLSSILSVSFIIRGDAGECDEFVEPQKVLGRVVSVERAGRTFYLNSKRAKMFRTARRYASALKQCMMRLVI
jgi:signal peptidase I